MDGQFQSWAKAEIERLRDEADHLERTLARYVASVAGARSSVPAGVTSFALRASPSRATKNEPVLVAIEKAGPRGLDLDDAHKAARDAGLDMSRDNLRSFLFNQKKLGRLVSLGVGRYAAAPQTNEAANPGSTGEFAASVPSTPNDAERRGEVGHDNMNP